MSILRLSHRSDFPSLRFNALSRRRFLSHAASAVAASAVFSRQALAHSMARAQTDLTNLDPNSLARFVDPLPIPAIAKPSSRKPVPAMLLASLNKEERAEAARTPLPYYRLSIREITAKLHRDLPPARLWSYGGTMPGPTFETRSGEGLLVEWTNALPPNHFMPIDRNLHCAGIDLPDTRAVIHLHGGRTPPESDGYPDDWFATGHAKTYYYPNRQDSALLWYHDHSMGLNRLNIYAGLVGLHIIRDQAEEALDLPRGKYEIPLVLMDRDITTGGQLNYPVSPDPEKPWVPEAFGELHLINGRLFPYLQVEPRKYRLRILNAANGRFYRLSFPKGVDVWQIGSDQGLLAAPLTVDAVQLAPAERADLIVDFSAHKSSQIELNSDAFVLMQFRVGTGETPARTPSPPALHPVSRIPESAATLTRRLTLDESLNMVSESMGMLLNKTPWHMPVTEKPVLGSTEIWELMNLTEDVHPIHIHMVRFQILDRRRFDAFEYMTAGTLRYIDAVMPPDDNELGWKDTVRVNSHTVTRIIVPFTGYAGKFVWHCHLLEHEDNEMMRPYEVVKG
jgi:spore coat protein A, manganese oxidase